MKTGKALLAVMVALTSGAIIGMLFSSGVESGESKNTIGEKKSKK